MAPRFLYAVSNKNSGEKLLNSAAQYLRLPVEEKEKWELLHQAKCYAVQRFLTKTIRSVRYLKSPYQLVLHRGSLYNFAGRHEDSTGDFGAHVKDFAKKWTAEKEELSQKYQKVLTDLEERDFNLEAYLKKQRVTPKPKRGMTAYSVFWNEQYAKLNSGGESSLTDTSRKVAELWHSLSDAQKQEYKLKALKSQTEYLEAKKAYQRELTLTDVMIDADKKTKKPAAEFVKRIVGDANTRQVSAYARFMSNIARENKAEGQGVVANMGLAKVSANKWAQLSDAQKQVLTDEVTKLNAEAKATQERIDKALADMGVEIPDLASMLKNEAKAAKKGSKARPSKKSRKKPTKKNDE